MDAEGVALRVHEVALPGHLWKCKLRHCDCASLREDLLRRLIKALNLDAADVGVGAETIRRCSRLAGQQTAINPRLLAVFSCRCNEPVLIFFPALKLPAEDRCIKIDGSLRFVCLNLKMYYAVHSVVMLRVHSVTLEGFAKCRTDEA